jgi:hypothetical protein
MREVIKGDQRSSEVIRAKIRDISGTFQGQSAAIWAEITGAIQGDQGQ